MAAGAPAGYAHRFAVDLLHPVLQAILGQFKAIPAKGVGLYYI